VSFPSIARAPVLGQFLGDTKTVVGLYDGMVTAKYHENYFSHLYDRNKALSLPSFSYPTSHSRRSPHGWIQCPCPLSSPSPMAGYVDRWNEYARVAAQLFDEMLQRIPAFWSSIWVQQARILISLPIPALTLLTFPAHSFDHRFHHS
jgi:uncharacterized damage-inducible protein DinB